MAGMAEVAEVLPFLPLLPLQKMTLHYLHYGGQKGKMQKCRKCRYKSFTTKGSQKAAFGGHIATWAKDVMQCYVSTQIAFQVH